METGRAVGVAEASRTERAGATLDDAISRRGFCGSAAVCERLASLAGGPPRATCDPFGAEDARFVCSPGLARIFADLRNVGDGASTLAGEAGSAAASVGGDASEAVDESAAGIPGSADAASAGSGARGSLAGGVSSARASSARVLFAGAFAAERDAALAMGGTAGAGSAINRERSSANA